MRKNVLYNSNEFISLSLSNQSSTLRRHSIDPYVVLKVLGDELALDPNFFVALAREASKTQRLRHPNIVSVYDFDRDGDIVYIVMEWLRGESIDALLSRFPNGVPFTEAWPIVNGMAQALAHAHDLGIVHSDFKPSNCLVMEDGEVKVLDFGVARLMSGQGGNQDLEATIFDSGNLGAMTPAYASSEQLNGQPPDQTDDVYAFGCVVYLLLTGNHPFDRLSAGDAAQKGLRPDPIPGLNRQQFRAIEKALAFERINRARDISELVRELDPSQSSKAAKLPLLVLAVGVAAAFTWAVVTWLWGGGA